RRAGPERRCAHPRLHGHGRGERDDVRHARPVALPPDPCVAASARGLGLVPDGYDGTKAYARCKRAQVVLAEEWTRDLLGTDIAVNAMHPGWADTPGLRASLPGFSRVVGPLLRTPEEGADTI